MASDETSRNLDPLRNNEVKWLFREPELEIVMEEHVRSYTAQLPDGTSVIVDEYQQQIDATNYGDAQRKFVPGLKRLQLRGGGSVNFIDERTFEIVATGQRLSAID